MIRAAESSITRGTMGTGIVGNARRVLIARDIIASAEGEVDTRLRVADWKEVHDQDQVGSAEMRKEVWICPGCKEAM